MARPTASGVPASNKREAILEAALACFAARGLSGTGLRDIAAAVGLTEGTLYHYFPSKEALVEAVFDASTFRPATVRQAMRDRGRPLRARLLAVGQEFLSVLHARPDWTRVLLREALRAHGSEARNRLKGRLISLSRERIEALARALEAEAAAGRIRAADTRLVAGIFFQALIGRWVTEAIGGRAPRSTRGEDPELAVLVDLFVRDLRPRRSRNAAPA